MKVGVWIRIGMLACALFALLAAPASAALVWSKPAPLTPRYAANPEVRLDARGLGLLTWGDMNPAKGDARGGLTYRWRAPDGRWSATRTIPRIRSAAYPPEVALTPRGEAVVAFGWRGREPLYAVAEPGGAFSEPKRLGEPGETGVVDLAVDDLGNAVATWLREDGAVRVASRKARGEFGEPQTLEVLTGEQIRMSAIIGPTASVNAAGAAAVTWAAGQVPGEDGRWYTRHRVAYRAAGGSFGTPEEVPRFPGTWHHVDQSATVAENGDVVVVLQEFVGGSGGASYTVRRAGGGWAEPREVGPLGYLTNVFAEPGGAVSFVIQRTKGATATGPGEPPPPGAYDRFVDFATHRPDGTLAGPRQISAADGYAPDAAMNQRGDVLAAWNTGPAEGDRKRVAVSDRIAGPLFGPELVLGAEGAWPPKVSLNEARQAAVTWNYDDERGGELDVAGWGSFRFDPELPPLPLPPDIDIGTPLDPLLDEDGIVLPVRCDRECTVRPEGLLIGAADRGKRAKKAGKVRIARGKRGRVRLRFDYAARTAAREALAAGRKPWVAVSVRAKGKSPRTMTASRRVKLRRR
jgi:hypothetical protein